MQTLSRSLGFALLLLSALPAGVWAQTTQCLITGRVVDSQTGEPVPGAQLTVEYPETNTRLSAVSDAGGFYLLAPLPPGDYRMRVTVDDYQPQEVHGLELRVASRIELPFKLRRLDDLWEKGRYRSIFFPDSEAVVTFYGPDVDTSRSGVFEARTGHHGALESTVSEVIRPVDLRALPFAGRDVYTMLLTQPGVTADTATARGLGLSINGQRPASSNFRLDGLENNNHLVTGPQFSLAPESVEEYRVSISSFSAEYGRTAGYLANAVTRSGGNAWHGIGYFHLKNDALNANDFQSNRRGLDRPPLKETQTGFHAGGPLRRDGLYFSGAFENLRTRNRAEAITVRVPAPNFARDFTAENSLARRLLTQFPTPALDAGNGVTSDLDARPPFSIDRSLFLARVDSISSNAKHRLMGRFTGANLERPDFIWYPWEQFNSELEQPGFHLGLNYFQTPRAGFLHELRLGWSSEELSWDRAHPEIPTLVAARTLVGPGDPPEAALRPTLLPGSPAFYAFRHRARSFELNDNLLWSRGRHIVKFGAGLFLRRIDSRLTAGRDARYGFRDILNFAFDLPETFEAPLARGSLPEFRRPEFERRFGYNQYYLFATDTWKVNSWLTLNFGLRYEKFGAPGARSANQDAAVVLGSGSSLAESLPSARIEPLGSGEALFRADNNDLAARFGFAYDLFGDSKTLLRGAYGIFYDRPFDNLWLNSGNNGFVLGRFAYQDVGGDDGYLAPVDSVLSAYEGRRFSGDFPRLTLFDPDLSNGYAQSLFVGVQRELTSNWSVEINHLASLGRKLITTDIVNRQFSVGRGGDNPQGRLNPELPDISYRAAQGASNYHALTAVGRYRSRRGFVQLAYSWSHTIDNQSDPLLGDFFDLTFIGSRAATGSRGTAAFSRQFDSAADRGSADFDQRHNLVFYSGWDVPALFSDSGVAPLFRNWRFAQVAAFRGGFPYSVFAPTRSLDRQGQILNQRADLLNPSAAEVDRVAAGGRQLLDTAAFSQPARGTLGNTGRNAFSGPGLYNVDLSISRVIPARWLGESGTVTLRADVFNVFNHANLNNPDALVGSSNFGFASYGRRGRDTGFPALTPLDETPRQIQLMLRFEF